MIKRKEIFIAEDNTEFDDYYDCARYNLEFFARDINNSIKLYNLNCEQIIFNAEIDIYYIIVKDSKKYFKMIDLIQDWKAGRQFFNYE